MELLRLHFFVSELEAHIHSEIETLREKTKVEGEDLMELRESIETMGHRVFDIRAMITEQILKLDNEEDDQDEDAEASE